MNNKGGKMKVLTRLGSLVFLGCFLLEMLGCASIKEMTRGLMGVSTRSLEKARKNAVSKNLNYDYSTAYTKTLDALKEMQAYIYRKNISKYMIAIYVSDKDTTPVGIFFKETGKDTTQIEVSSPSSYARDVISAKLFSALSGNPIIAESAAKPLELKSKMKK
jgi:hypothetical protein